VVLGVFFVRPSFQWLGESVSVGSETVLRCWRVGLPAFARTVLKRAGDAVDLRHAPSSRTVREAVVSHAASTPLAPGVLAKCSLE
jgi:hypothetical protein